MNKANNLLGLIKRSVGTTNVNVFSTLYLSLVRPILEYALPVWCPLVKDIRALESIQRKASRLALNQHKGEVPYADRCKLSKWPSLSDRRNYLSLTECYKFVVWIFMISSNSQKLQLGLQASTRANHPFKLYVKSARLDCYKYSFFIRIVSKWSDLPRDIVEAESLHHFKNRASSLSII